MRIAGANLGKGQVNLVVAEDARELSGRSPRGVALRDVSRYEKAGEANVIAMSIRGGVRNQKFDEAIAVKSTARPSTRGTG